MTPHLALALGVRLFAVWYALVAVRELVAFLTSWRPPDASYPLGIVVGGSLISLVILLTLWFFPKSIARGPLPKSSDASSQTSSYQMWLTLGIAFIGLWFVASAIAPILRNVSVMYFFKSELTNLEDMRSLRAGLLYYAVELVIGFCLLFGAPGIQKLIVRIRNAVPD